MNKKFHVKKGDTVQVIAGNDKGSRGKVLLILTDKDRVIVEGVNMRTKHEKPTQENPQGSRTQREMPIHISNVQVVDPSTDKPTRVGRKSVEKDGQTKNLRYAKKSGELL